jgi:tetratricopeptide (TPR) repeat protein
VKAQSFYNLGDCYLQQKNYEAAIVAFKQALKINPRDEDARYNLSFAAAIVNRQSGSSSQKKKEQKEQQQPKPLTNLTPEDMKRILNDEL